MSFSLLIPLCENICVSTYFRKSVISMGRKRKRVRCEHRKGKNLYSVKWLWTTLYFSINTFSDFFLFLIKLGLIITKVHPFHHIYEIPVIVLNSNSVMGNLGDPSCFKLARDHDQHIFSQTDILLDELRRTSDISSLRQCNSRTKAKSQHIELKSIP